jgi:hypothetical protein
MYKRIAIGISSIALSLAIIVSGLILQSPSIAFALMLEVKFKGGTLNEKTELMKGFATSEISLGTFALGDTQNIELGVSLPGEEMGNE